MRLVADGWTETPETNRRKAIENARRALHVAESDPEVLANAAFVLAQLGEDISAMIALVDRALALNPGFARGWFFSGALRLWAGELDLAVEHMETSLRLSPRKRKRVFRASRSRAGRRSSCATGSCPAAP